MADVNSKEEYYELSEFDSADENEDDQEDVVNGIDSRNSRIEVDKNGSEENEEVSEKNYYAAAEADEDGTFTRPEIRLVKLRKENVDIDFKLAQTNKIRCLALCKILHGERHWEVAEAHIELASVYLKGKYFPHQTLEHTNIARDMLLVIQSSDNLLEGFNMEYLLQNLYYLMGMANYQLGKYKVSENCLQKAKLVADKAQNATKKFLSMKVTILSSLAMNVCKLGLLGQAIEHIEEGLEIIGKISGDNKHLTMKLYKQIVTVELLNGKHANFTSASEAAIKALKLSESSDDEQSSTAEIYILLSKVEALKEIPDFSKVEETIQKAMVIYTDLGDIEKSLSTQQMLCKVLMQQEKFSEAKTVLGKCISECELVKGDMSLQSAELYELMGSISLAQNKMTNALNHFLKAEEIYLGKKKHIKKQEKIKRIIDIIRRSSKDDMLKTSEDKLKERPRFLVK